MGVFYERKNLRKRVKRRKPVRRVVDGSESKNKLLDFLKSEEINENFRKLAEEKRLREIAERAKNPWNGKRNRGVYLERLSVQTNESYRVYRGIKKV